MRRYLVLTLAVLAAPPALALAVDVPAEDWDWVKPGKQVAAQFKGTPGVVLHIGDSITYANPYGGWARNGAGQTAEDKAVLKWMHTNDKNDSDGWFLAAVDRPGNRSDTAASGMRLDEALATGKSGLPNIAALLKKYNPQIVVLMLGTNDASGGRPVEKYAEDLDKAIKTVADAHALLILSTLPPHPGKLELVKQYNDAIRAAAKKNGLPLIEYYAAIMKLAPDDWNGTILGKGDVHPTAGNSGAAPTDENFKKSGYLLRGWLSVQKIKEVKAKVIDGLPAGGGEKPASKPAAAATDGKTALIEEGYDYAKGMIEVAKKFRGMPGVVLHVGDSNVYANPYGQWARGGAGQTDDDKAVLKWAFANDEANQEKDGFYLCRVDREGNRSDTAGSPVGYSNFIKGEGMTSAKELVKKYNPQIMLVMLGTWDAAARRSADDIKTDIEEVAKICRDNGTVLILSTASPYPNEPDPSKTCNDAIKEEAKKLSLPLLDFWGQATKLAGEDADGKIVQKGAALLTIADNSAAQEPTEANLKVNGYLLKGWLSVKKIEEVKKKVIDPAGKEK